MSREDSGESNLLHSLRFTELNVFVFPLQHFSQLTVTLIMTMSRTFAQCSSAVFRLAGVP